MFKVGDYVTRNKYGNDIVFIIDKIEKEIVYLKGVDIRLYADSKPSDLVKVNMYKKKDNVTTIRHIRTEDFFYVPGKILHLDSDKLYLDKCLNYYKDQNIKAYGYLNSESTYEDSVVMLVKKYRPDIIIITGHDAYYKNKKNGKYYKNSEYYINTVKRIKEFTNEAVIFAGACQSDYDGIIKAGSTFASSPKHTNIHALDPAIIGSYIALKDINETIDIKNLLSMTHYGSDGIGGLVIKGKMYSGYPRGGN